MTIELPPDLDPKAVEAIEDFVESCRIRFTGPFLVHLKEGVPQKRERTEHHAYGRNLAT